MQVLTPLFHVFVFPGFLFLVAFGLFASWVDRKLIAKMQNRVGPPMFQPFADLIKLLAKEDIVPEHANRAMFAAAPLVAFAGVIASVIYIPMWSHEAVNSFTGDLIVVIYLLTLPAFALVLGGWYSTNPFATIGATRVLSQLFGYEVPFFLACLGPAVAANSWSISDIALRQSDGGWLIVAAPLSFAVAMIALIGKLERVPFDIPQAKTEIVTGPEVEYSGRRLAVWKLTFLTETIVGAALIAALFLGGPHFWGIPYASMAPWLAGLVGMIVLAVKIMLIVFFLSLTQAAMARIRIDQMVQWCLVWLGIPALINLGIIIFTTSQVGV
ncbi:MAG: complex I subunit 1 family protein [Armatimonadota bacterium]|jgi:NADH-quinone oxidoreductase subunit H